MNVLITGFDPFGGEPINPAWEAVKAMKDEIAGAKITKLQIPTVVNKSIAKVHEKMMELHPDIVISIGQAGGRFGVTPERVAINVTDARIPDNEGNQPIDEPIFADGDAAYFSGEGDGSGDPKCRLSFYPLQHRRNLYLQPCHVRNFILYPKGISKCTRRLYPRSVCRFPGCQ